MMEQEIRERMVVHGKSLFDRRYTCGGSGNMSVRLRGGVLVTPTNSCLGRLEKDRISKLDWEGKVISGDAPSKEWSLHLAVYRARPDAGAVVHLHSPHAAAVSCLNGLNAENVLPPITPYFVMRIGRLPLVPYYPPGDPGLAEAVGRLAVKCRGVLLAHHGEVAAGRDLDDAVYNAEELEETARLFLILRKENYAVLDHDAVEELRRRFG
ncbi:MAG: 3-oxo-tetronate 4-phosphate decarboxylase [Hyphomicrobiales bacterium]